MLTRLVSWICLFLLSLMATFFLHQPVHSKPLDRQAIAQASSGAPVESGRILQDVFNSENTPVIQSIAACLPANLPQAQSTYFGLIASAELAGQDGTPSRYFYVQVTPIKYPDGAAVPQPWFTLVEQLSNNSGCINHLPQPTSVPLSALLPVETAAKFTEARYNLLRQTNPQEFESLARYFANGGVNFNEPNAPMDDPIGCQIYPDEQIALNRVGISIASTCKVLAVPN